MGESLNATLSIAAPEESGSLEERNAQAGTMKANAHKTDRIKGQLEREKQFNRRVEINAELRIAIEELERLMPAFPPQKMTER